jgi:hypothetical protein
MLFAMLTIAAFMSSTVEAPAYKSVACDFFTHQNAVKVLGGNATGADGGEKEIADGRQWTCTFTASDRGDDPPKLHFGIIKSNSEDAAKVSFEAIRQSNKTHPGYQEWPGVGDEAAVHSDGKNFYLVMIRKGVRTMRAKVGPARGTSLEALKDAMASLVSKLEGPKKETKQ